MPISLFNTQAQIPTTSTPRTDEGGLARKHDEGYTQWGSRYAGQTNADKNALTPALHQVILENQREQRGDEEQQERRRNEIRGKIEVKKNDIASREGRIATKDQEKNNILSQIKDKEQEIINIKEGNQHRGMATIYYWIGAIVTAGLGIYLFIFYSSAAFSAFFRGNFENVKDAILYPYALQDSLAMSLGIFLFILFMPTIFIALGIIMHSLSKKKGNSKYFKITALYFITFCFDALLAFGISQKLYIPTQANPQYTMRLAFNSPDFWIIIFSGFIAYIIWGLVFDFTMENYDEMTNGATTIKRLNSEILALKDKANSLQQLIEQIRNEINQLKNEIEKLQHDLNAKVTYDLDKIKQCLNQFFGGWIGYMNLVGRPEDDRTEATTTFNNVLTSRSLTTI